ncbi:MAG TPA: DUF1385 domain-containing protein [Actinomycetota bacterium]|nr:DUF1385 domain-containing protein [Actinomycetota bacterium]
MTEHGAPADPASPGAPEPVPSAESVSPNGSTPVEATDRQPVPEPAPDAASEPGFLAETGPIGTPVPGPRANDPERQQHYYGGQAVIEGVMMRGRDHWAIAVRKADGDLHTESHRVKTIGDRYPFMKTPGLRGILALGQALSIGFRALTISANASVPEEERLTRKQMAFSMTFAIILFALIFFVGPALLFGFARKHVVHNSLVSNLLEGLFRVALFLGYLLLISMSKEVRRVFQYHGAEHKTIAAYEHDAPLEPESVDRFSTLHVRCGTNFLLIVMIMAIIVFALFGNPGWLWTILSRIIAIPIIAGLAFEMLRLGARFQNSVVMRVLMAPGLWLQKITTRPPTHDQIEVAIASFESVLAVEAVDRATAPSST